ncbi:hypothetical protein [Niveispirillum sp. BGYR6]|uniref:hypothetical protein n=1 Tax=Niveispirillum sp. BGYR6 TaxID=2971249 RepID=UPI0022B98116|nr:hypothetical protein [Niveispirillum sp. BGYR6]MDG5495405.1 hypothetical protein [Niveispirillum sp. BGYR6]
MVTEPGIAAVVPTAPLCAAPAGTHIWIMTNRIHLLGLMLALGLLAAPALADNPLLSPAPGTTPTRGPSALSVERDRAQADALRSRAEDRSLGVLPPDPMQQREATSNRLQADQITRSLQGPGAVPMTPGDEALRDTLGQGQPLPGAEMPAPRISHGRAPGKPSPVQSSPVPDRKPVPPGQ